MFGPQKCAIYVVDFLELNCEHNMIFFFSIIERSLLIDFCLGYLAARLAATFSYLKKKKTHFYFDRFNLNGAQKRRKYSSRYSLKAYSTTSTDILKALCLIHLNGIVRWMHLKRRIIRLTTRMSNRQMKMLEIAERIDGNSMISIVCHGEWNLCMIIKMHFIPKNPLM